MPQRALYKGEQSRKEVIDARYGIMLGPIAAVRH